MAVINCITCVIQYFCSRASDAKRQRHPTSNAPDDMMASIAPTSARTRRASRSRRRRARRRPRGVHASVVDTRDSPRMTITRHPVARSLVERPNPGRPSPRGGRREPTVPRGSPSPLPRLRAPSRVSLSVVGNWGPACVRSSRVGSLHPPPPSSSLSRSGVRAVALRPGRRPSPPRGSLRRGLHPLAPHPNRGQAPLWRGVPPPLPPPFTSPRRPRPCPTHVGINISQDR